VETSGLTLCQLIHFDEVDLEIVARGAALTLPPINAIMQPDFVECFQNKDAMVFF
jgi:hypothetical protein